MPGYDQTGPAGQGPMTGRGFGNCGSSNRVSYGAGMGMRRGFGAGFGGRGRRCFAGMNRVPTSIQPDLSERIEQLEAELQQLKELHENSDHQR